MSKDRFNRRWFRPIPGFPRYWINKAGKIWSERTRKFLKWWKNIKGYWRVQLYLSGVRHWMFVHRLTLITFHKNPDPENKTQGNHKDWNIENPHADNMEWNTPSENQKHARKKPWRSTFSSTSRRIDEKVYCPF